MSGGREMWRKSKVYYKIDGDNSKYNDDMQNYRAGWHDEKKEGRCLCVKLSVIS